MTEGRLADVPQGAAGWAALREAWWWLLAVGVLWILLGAMAVILPLAVTVGFALLLGAIFAAGGAVQLVQAFRCRGWAGSRFHAASGALGLAIGIALLAFPLEGVLALSVMLGAYFVVEGALNTVYALRHRVVRAWGWTLLSGVFGMGIGLLLWLGWPGTAVWFLALLIGIRLLFSGLAMVMLALSARALG